MPTTPRRDLRADLALAGAAFLFGSTFLVVQDAVEDDGAIPFLAVRFGIAALVLVPMAIRRGRPAPGFTRAVLVLGALLAAGYVLQTVGLQDTTSSVSAFITYLLVVFVPILSAVVLRAMPTPLALIGVVLAVLGLVLLTAGAGGGGSLVDGLGRGELLTLGCAVAFAAHIVALAADAPRFDVVQLNLGQFSVVAVVLVVPGALTGGYRLSPSTLLAAAYTGVVVSAVAFGLQVWGQRQVSATRTALVLLLEPVFAAALGYVAGERLGLLGALGAGVIIVAILVSEVGGPLVVRRRPRVAVTGPGRGLGRR